ncbi:MAG: hypothetical protein IPJ56_06940 [Gemmatimonadetes bacterium]|nr:hypothetical protein [Gemmatimonadota bacterium]
MFSVGNPADLKISYLEADDDYNQDGVVNGADTRLERTFRIWKLHASNPWAPQTSIVSRSLDEVETKVYNFTSYARRGGREPPELDGVAGLGPDCLAGGPRAAGDRPRADPATDVGAIVGGGDGRRGASGGTGGRGVAARRNGARHGGHAVRGGVAHQGRGGVRALALVHGRSCCRPGYRPPERERARSGATASRGMAQLALPTHWGRLQG